MTSVCSVGRLCQSKMLHITTFGRHFAVFCISPSVQGHWCNPCRAAANNVHASPPTGLPALCKDPTLPYAINHGGLHPHPCCLGIETSIDSTPTIISCIPVTALQIMEPPTPNCRWCRSTPHRERTGVVYSVTVNVFRQCLQSFVETFRKRQDPKIYTDSLIIN